MHSFITPVAQIVVIKENIKLGRYNKGEELKCDFNKIEELVWGSINNINTDNLEELCSFHSFLIDEVCKVHIVEECEPNNKLLNRYRNFKDIIPKLKDSSRSSNIYFFNELKQEYYIIGDLHSDKRSIVEILEKCDFFNGVIEKRKLKLIFLGDYVDRGKLHLRALETILCLKLIFPENIFLLRGNHDGGSIIGGEVKLCVGKPKDDPEDFYFMLYLQKLVETNSTFKAQMIEKYIEFFNSLAYLAYIQQGNIGYLCLHGGLPRPLGGENSCFAYIKSISDLTNINIVDHIDRSIVHNIMWSDPSEGEEDLRHDSGRFKFTQENFNEFCSDFGVDILLRGHEAEENGYKTYFKGRLYTIFSSGAIFYKGVNINRDTYYENIAPAIGHILSKGSIEILKI